jgi:Membrane protein implicated in regulation of membrane protease activity
MTLFGITLEPHWWWLVLGLVLGIAEIVVPGVFLIWIGAAAIVTGLLALLLPLPVAAEFVIFAITAIGAVYVGRRYLKANPIESDDPLLNDRAARLIGKQVVVVEAISGGDGKVKVGDTIWLATGPDAQIGARVKIIGADGSRLKIEPVAEPDPV